MADTPRWGLREATVRLGAITAVEGVSVDAPAGEVTAVVGGDGAGKTTLLRAMAGRVGLDRGRVVVPPPEQIGFLPSSGGVWRQLSVQENLDFVGSAYRIPRRLLAARQRELLERADLADAGNTLGAHLSGGMRQKLGFCLAILHEPVLVLLDEPSTGVDPVSRVELWRMLAETAAAGTAVLMTTTYLDEAERANTVVAMDAGQVLASGAPQQIVHAMPGAITASAARPATADLSWRRGTMFHTWAPPGTTPHDEPVAPDLEDTMIALTLSRRLGAEPSTPGTLHRRTAGQA